MWQVPQLRSVFDPADTSGPLQFRAHFLDDHFEAAGRDDRAELAGETAARRRAVHRGERGGDGRDHRELRLEGGPADRQLVEARNLAERRVNNKMDLPVLDGIDDGVGIILNVLARLLSNRQGHGQAAHMQAHGRADIRTPRANRRIRIR